MSDAYDDIVVKVRGFHVSRRPLLYVLIGPPAAGKSTWRENLLDCRRIVGHPREVVVISTDDVIDRYAAEWGVYYAEAFAKLDHDILYTEAEASFNAAVDNGQDIILDRTNLSAKSRAPWLLAAAGYCHIAVVFEVPRHHLDARLRRRQAETGKAIPAEAVDNLLARYDPPGQCTEFDEIIRVSALS